MLDRNHLEQFISIYPGIENCFYQYFDDNAERKNPALTSLGNYLSEDSFSLLEDMNNKGAGIFFSVNGFESERRKQADVKFINAWICEIDNMAKEFQMNLIDFCPLKPSLIVESKKGYHLYWFAKEGTKDNWRNICNALRNFFDGDHKVITEERVMRLPGFDHMKDGSDPFPIKMLGGDLDYHTEEEMMVHYNDFETHEDRMSRKNSLKFQIGTYKDDDKFWERAGKIDSETMLSYLSGTHHVSGDTFDFKKSSGGIRQIFVNGKSTSSWVDKDGKIGSYDKGGPTWIQWLNRYGAIDYKQIYRIVIDKFPNLKRESKKGGDIISKAYVQDDESYLVEYDRDYKTDYDTVIPFTRGVDILDEKLGRINKGIFATTLGESGSGKTTFVFHQCIKLSETHKVLFVSLEMNQQRIIELRARKMAGISKVERDNKTMPQSKKELMEKYQKEIKENKNLAIVGINKSADYVDVDLIIKTFHTKYSDYNYIVIDNLGFIKAEEAKKEKGFTSVYEEMNYVVRQFKNFCHNYGKTVNLLHHFKKGNSENRASRSLGDVLGTGKLENDVDCAIIVARAQFKPNDYEDASPQDRAEVVIDLCKDRDNGEVMRQSVYFYKSGYYSKRDDNWNK